MGRASVASAAMKVLQRVSEIVIERNVGSLITESGFEPSLTYLAVAGGVALNCPANSRLMQKFGFAGLLAPPCVDDSGQALGLGLLGFSAMTSESSFDFRLGHAFHGSRRIDRLEALAEIGDGIVDVSELDDAQFYDDITSCPVAWIDGRAELGPRALGHRSILADPRSIDSKSRLNEIKGRQWWRPVAPIVLHDRLGQWFEAARPSPFMLETFQVRHESSRPGPGYRASQWVGPGAVRGP